MTLYSANNQQLFLQSVNEQRNLGGLFSATAEWIRPVGSEELPTSIPTSLGEIEIFPEPVVSVGTDGFERITATGYDIWDQSTFVQKNYQVGAIEVKITSWSPAPNPVSRDDAIASMQTFLSAASNPGSPEEIILGQLGFSTESLSGDDLSKLRALYTAIINAQDGLNYSTIIFGLSKIDLGIVANLNYQETIYQPSVRNSTFEGYIFEVAYLKKMRPKGSSSVPTAPELFVRNQSGEIISVFSPPSDPSLSGQISKQIRITNININNFGSVEEVEVVYSITKATVAVAYPQQ
jgi:hypothetical protein